MTPLIRAIILLLIAPLSSAAALEIVRQEETPTTELRSYILEMKERARGPFFAIRWFCNDQSVRGPRAGCGTVGGVQHGQWTDETKKIRNAGYPIATVYASLTLEEKNKIHNDPSYLSFLLLERFLMNFDDGWIYQKAKNYRGAFQVEDEIEVSQTILIKMLEDPLWRAKRYFLIREAIRLLPRSAPTELVTIIRATASRLGASQSRFRGLRNKIHSFPDPGDAARVRKFAETVPKSQQNRYFELAELIDEANSTQGIKKTLSELTQSPDSKLAIEAQSLLSVLQQQASPEILFERYANFLLFIRERTESNYNPRSAFSAISASIQIEQELYANGALLTIEPRAASREAWIKRMINTTIGLYGTGFLSKREYRAARTILAELLDTSIPIERYYRELRYLTLIPGWAASQIEFDFGQAMTKFEEIEPLARSYSFDRIRQSPLLFYSQALEILLRDASEVSGLKHAFLGKGVSSGLRALNPGIARGILVKEENLVSSGVPLDQAIVMASATSPDLPPVAGIISGHEGNLLSHIQLLARNLGIPNIVVSEELIRKLHSMIGRKIVLVATPKGTVEIANDAPRWDPILASTKPDSPTVLVPNLRKLELDERELLTLKELRASDSGETVGPKAAKLGELKYRFPEYVTEGVTLPFGLYRQILSLPYRNGQTLWEWLKAQYQKLETLPTNSTARKNFQRQFLYEAKQAFLAVRFNESFKEQLRAKLKEQFGEPGTYGVFVRSDSNVEDLPNFTGAGLNLTVPHLVNFEDILEGIKKVWASGFSERAFAWRQSAMEQPEHVYMSVLLMKSVSVDRSGVLVTADIETGDRDYLTVAANEGVGGVVSNQAAETLRIARRDGTVRLYATAGAHFKKSLSRNGGVIKTPIQTRNQVLSGEELKTLYEFAAELPDRFPRIRDSRGRRAPAEVEFGFVDGKLALFQVRPFLQSVREEQTDYLNSLDKKNDTDEAVEVILAEPPIGRFH